MTDSRVFWRRFGPSLYWDDALRVARERGIDQLVLATEESSRIVGLDLDRWSLVRRFSLTPVAQVGEQRVVASYRHLMTDAVCRGGLRRDLDAALDVQARLADYVTCLCAAREYLSASLTVEFAHGPLAGYLRRYWSDYPHARQYQSL